MFKSGPSSQENKQELLHELGEYHKWSLRAFIPQLSHVSSSLKHSHLFWR